MSELYRSTVTHIGSDAHEMFEAGVYILFGEPVPPALADMSLVHRKETQDAPELRVGDSLFIGGVEMRLDEIGDLASKNLAELGHSVVYLNQPGQKLLPGAIKASSDQTPQPAVGDAIVFTRG